MEKISLIEVPILTTKQLVLRGLNDRDDQALYLLRSNEKVNKFIDRIVPKNIDNVRQFIINICEKMKQNNCFYWAICFKEGTDLIGTICLWNFSDDRSICEIGYELNPAFQGRGLMNEAVKEIIQFGFQKIALKRIEAYTHRENISSIRLLEKNGFVLDPDIIDKENSNNIIYILSE